VTRRSGLFLALACVLGLAAFAFYWSTEQSLLPEPVPLGKTVTQQLPGPDGKPETWTLTKQEVPREKLQDLVLPQASPRQAPPSESARGLEGQALESWKHGDVAAALKQFEAAVEADPEDPEVRTQYGRLLTLMADFNGATLQLERAAQLKPDDAQVWLDLLTLYEKNVLLERAGYAREKAEALAPRARITKDENGFYFLDGGTLFP
jgi:tetratricopeptide (TPR) repeat protein